MTVTYDEVHALKLLSEGSPKGFRLIYSHYAPRVAQASYRLLRSRELAEDLMQEIFTKVWVERERFASADNFEHYLFTCVRNKTLDYIRQKGKEETARTQAFALRSFDENSVDDYMHNKELMELVNQAVAELPKQRKRIFIMMKEQGLTTKEIAGELNISPFTVRNHIVEARSFIHRRIEQHIAISVYASLSTMYLS